MSGWRRTGGGGRSDGRNANAGEGWARGAAGGVAFPAERDQEEYIFVHDRDEERAGGAADPRRPRRHRPGSRASDSASIHFLTDDREEARGEGATQLLARDLAEIHLSQPRQNPPPMGEVDYSPNDFRQARAAIEDAATRQQNDGPSGRGSSGRRSAGSGRRVRHFGDTTVITEHRDPYSFYWQLDKLKRAEQEPPRPMPPADYVLEDEEEAEEEEDELADEDEFPEDYLSPDSGVHLMEREPFKERHYALPMKEWGEDPSRFSHYWQVDSGPRQEEMPPAELRRKRPESPPAEETPIGRPSPPKQISVSDVGQQTALAAEEPLIEEHAFRQTTTRRRVELAEEGAETAHGLQHALTNGLSESQLGRFVVRPLGQVEVSDGDLADMEQSHEVMNRAMAQLGTAGAGEGEAVLEVSDRELRLVEPVAREGDVQRVLRRDPLEHIRVWGTGGHGDRDFAYVSRNSADGRLLCRVFRCRDDSSQEAKKVADALRDACHAVLLRQQPRDRPDSLSSSLASSRRRRRTRESLPATPIEEPKRIIRCHFIGVTQVPRATGIETLNEAVDRLVTDVGRERWTQVDVHISPSMICVFESAGARRQIASCRVRYLSFLGIGRDVKHCAFIVAQSFDHFVCYVFYADPSASSLAKTIEAACKLRYQKVMDAHLPESGK
uniref:PID domain-containing protein n=1 Tax=Globodera rostochiensis TaxID=31243 RepID=A0A914HBL5_GLORO